MSSYNHSYLLAFSIRFFFFLRSILPYFSTYSAFSAATASLFFWYSASRRSLVAWSTFCHISLMILVIQVILAVGLSALTLSQTSALKRKNADSALLGAGGFIETDVLCQNFLLCPLYSSIPLYRVFPFIQLQILYITIA